MRIGVLSDTHSQTVRIQVALSLLRDQSVETIIHCGDIQSVETIHLFDNFRTHFVLGNWDGDWIAGINSGDVQPRPDGRKRDPAKLVDAINRIGGELHEPWGELVLDSVEIAWIHGDNSDLFQELENSNCFDFLFYGHTHEPEQHRTGRTQVVNPGAFYKISAPQFVIFDTKSQAVERVVLSDSTR